MILGVDSSACGSSCIARLKCSLLTWTPPASVSRKASTRTYSAGLSRLRDHSNHRLPASARVAAVNAATSSGQRSVHSGLVSNLTTMKIIGAPRLCSELSVHPLALDPCEQRQDTAARVTVTGPTTE